MAYMTARRALVAMLAEQVDEDGGGGGWVYVADVERLARTTVWAEEIRKWEVQPNYVGWYASVLVEFANDGFLSRERRGVYKKTEWWGKLLQMVEAWGAAVPVKPSPVDTSVWGELRWVVADLVDKWTEGERITAMAVRHKVASKGMNGLAAGKALADFASRNGVLKRVREGVYEKTEGWEVVAEELEAYHRRKKVAMEEAKEFPEGRIHIYSGPKPATPDDPPSPLLTTVPADATAIVAATRASHDAAILTFSDILAHAESLAQQVVEWRDKYQQVVVLLRHKEADVEAAMRMLSDMEEVVMKKNAELEETKGELITREKQYENLMSMARVAKMYPQVSNLVVEEQGLDDDKPPLGPNGGGDGGGAAA